MSDNDSPFEGWVILELFGHRRLGGWLSEQEIAGAAFVRIDIPVDPPITQLYNARSAIYAITPTTEAMARAVAKTATPAPVSRWELPAADPMPDEDSDASDGESPF
jgi:hypothetical protein